MRILMDGVRIEMKKMYENLEIAVVMLAEDIITDSTEISWEQDWNV